MTQQQLLFGGTAIQVTRAVEPAERKRLSRQCQAILFRLRRGPASNYDLAQIALKYTGRLHEIRQAGYDVRIQSRDHASGRVVYALRSEP